MNFEFRARTNPGDVALFVAEVRMEIGRLYGTRRWAGLWLTYWVYRPKFWRDWLWHLEGDNEGSWRTFQVRLLGFEVTLQLWRKQDD